MATLTYVYSDSTAVVGPLATVREPHSWDLCLAHASRITAPRGWELVRHAAPLPTNPDEDDLVALADAVREGVREGRVSGGSPMPSFSDPVGTGMGGGTGAGTSSGEVASRSRLTPPSPRSGSAARRRGHLRVLPDPAD